VDPEGAAKDLTELLPKYPQNVKLLWTLGDIYRKQERPVLAALYFRAVMHTHRRTGLTPPQLQVLDEWYPQASPADRDVARQIAQLEQDYQAYEDEYHVGVIAYPESINGVLNRPANQHAADAGYLPPISAVPCGPDKPRCGYHFRMGSGRFWQSLAEQKLTISEELGGSDCCVLRLDDPDLRAFDRVMEAEFMRDPERMDSIYSTTTQEGRRARLALQSRILVKQHFVLEFADHADKNFSEERPWTIWSWVLLIGWLIVSLLLDEMIRAGIARLRGRRPAGP